MFYANYNKGRYIDLCVCRSKHFRRKKMLLLIYITHDLKKNLLCLRQVTLSLIFLICLYFFIVDHKLCLVFGEVHYGWI